MPTHREEDRFLDDFDHLTREQRTAFLIALDKFIEDVRRGSFRKGLRVKRVQGHPGVWEMTWAGDGRATFTYGASLRPGDSHIIWLRIGTHDIFDKPGVGYSQN